jgi:hypothetical protein
LQDWTAALPFYLPQTLLTCTIDYLQVCCSLSLCDGQQRIVCSYFLCRYILAARHLRTLQHGQFFNSLCVSAHQPPRLRLRGELRSSGLRALPASSVASDLLSLQSGGATKKFHIGFRSSVPNFLYDLLTVLQSHFEQEALLTLSSNVVDVDIYLEVNSSVPVTTNSMKYDGPFAVYCTGNDIDCVITVRAVVRTFSCLFLFVWVLSPRRQTLAVWFSLWSRR